VNEGRGDYIPIFLSEIPNLFKRNIIPLDVALVHVSLPDPHGYCSLGVSVDVAATAVKTAKYVIAQVNPNMPRTFGDGQAHIGSFDALVYTENALPEVGSQTSQVFTTCEVFLLLFVIAKRTDRSLSYEIASSPQEFK
jgi:acyl-CoA hydrolase